jgi:hypothetical protein
MPRKPKAITLSNTHEVAMYLLFDMTDSSFANYSQNAQGALTSFRADFKKKPSDRRSYMMREDYLNTLIDGHFTPEDRNKMWAYFRKQAALSKARNSDKKLTSITFNESEMDMIRSAKALLNEDLRYLKGDKVTQSQTIFYALKMMISEKSRLNQDYISNGDDDVYKSYYDSLKKADELYLQEKEGVKEHMKRNDDLEEQKKADDDWMKRHP